MSEFAFDCAEIDRLIIAAEDEKISIEQRKRDRLTIVTKLASMVRGIIHALPTYVERKAVLIKLSGQSGLPVDILEGMVKGEDLAVSLDKLSEQVPSFKKWAEACRAADESVHDFNKSVEPLRGILRIETPEGPIAVNAVVLTRLLEKGLVVRWENGEFHSPSKAEANRWIDEYGVCDFCTESEGVPHIISVPDHDLPHDIGKSTGGWAACDACYQLVLANRRADLLQRGVSSMAHGKYTAAAVRALHNSFWRAYDVVAEAEGIRQGMMGYINDDLPTPKAKQTDKERRIEVMRKMTGLSEVEMDAVQRGDMAFQEVAAKLSAWKRKFGSAENARKAAEAMAAHEAQTLLPGMVPHWQMALDKKFEALTTLTKAMHAIGNHLESSEGVDLHDQATLLRVIKQAEARRVFEKMQFAMDAKHLSLAETYSFNAETTHAIQMGAKSIPHESPLSSVELPKGSAGWYWFAEPLSISSAPAVSNYTNALLWGWGSKKLSEDGPETAVLRFSAFVLDMGNTDNKGKMWPSTQWEWPVHLSFHEMIAWNTAEYRERYGPDAPIGDQRWLLGEEQTFKIIAELSLFFMMSCVWFKQHIIMSAPGHVERHARKRIQKEHKLKEPPSVQVIALRRTHRDPSGISESVKTDSTGRKLFEDYQIVVDGHSKLQRCGPGGTDRKLIWISAYNKGNLDAPLREKRKKVYAVVR